jgi:hypothetical protein
MMYVRMIVYMYVQAYSAQLYEDQRGQNGIMAQNGRLGHVHSLD